MRKINNQYDICLYEKMRIVKANQKIEIYDLKIQFPIDHLAQKCYTINGKYVQCK